MKINGISKNFINYNYQNSQVTTPIYENNIQTSIYNQKGLTLPFGARFKPLNLCEENCVGMLRKINDGTHQRFLQNDVNEIMTSLRKEKDPKEMERFLGNLIEALQDTECDKHSFKRLIQLIAGKSEDDQYTILAFADHELQNAVEPLKAFAELPADKRERLMPFLNRIHLEQSSEKTTEALYDTFRTLVYAEEDMSKLSGEALNKYKVDTCIMLRDNIGYFENNANENSVLIAKDIYHYFVDNMI